MICPERFKSHQEQAAKTIDVESEQMDVQSDPKDAKEEARKKDTQASSSNCTVKETRAMDLDKKPFKKARVIRVERKKSKLLSQGKTPEEIEAIFEENRRKNSGKTVEEYLGEIYTESSRLQVNFRNMSRCTNNLIRALYRTR